MEEASLWISAVPTLFSFALHYQLMKGNRPLGFQISGCAGRLARRIINHMYDFSSLHTFAETLKTKNTTRTQINRALLHIILGIRQDDFLPAVRPKYLRLLGSGKESEPLLKMIKDNASFLLTTRACFPFRVIFRLRFQRFHAVRKRKIRDQRHLFRSRIRAAGHHCIKPPAHIILSRTEKETGRPPVSFLFSVSGILKTRHTQIRNTHRYLRRFPRPFSGSVTGIGHIVIVMHVRHISHFKDHDRNRAPVVAGHRIVVIHAAVLSGLSSGAVMVQNRCGKAAALVMKSSDPPVGGGSDECAGTGSR